MRCKFLRCLCCKPKTGDEIGEAKPMISSIEHNAIVASPSIDDDNRSLFAASSDLSSASPPENNALEENKEANIDVEVAAENEHTTRSTYGEIPPMREDETIAASEETSCLVEVDKNKKEEETPDEQPVENIEKTSDSENTECCEQPIKTDELAANTDETTVENDKPVADGFNETFAEDENSKENPMNSSFLNAILNVKEEPTTVSDAMNKEETQEISQVEETKNKEDTQETTQKEEAQNNGLKVVGINDLRTENHAASHTSEYETDALITRRGDPIRLKLELQEPYVAGQSELTFQMTMKSGGTSMRIQLYDANNPKQSYYKIVSSQGNSLTVEITLSSRTIVSRYSLKAATSGLTWSQYTHPKDVIVLFNPWHRDDEVYMEDANLLKEYVLRDTGNLYLSGKRAREWLYGQFEDAVLQVTLDFLESVSPTQRDTVREVARFMTSKANSFNGGILVGNWSGDYSGGVKPWVWNGCVKIFKQFQTSRQSVNYGQCWVFSGIVTSMMRTLGIPARSVTNYSSAHDTDANCTFDKYFKSNGEYDEEMSNDSAWNFHVWNDVWMVRSDLAHGYGGWQAIDGTPQEESGGLYQCGPSPLLAIKEGHVKYSYDTKFVFAEVNADAVYWKQDETTGEYKPFSIRTDSIGRDMSTTKPNSFWREDVTSAYKFKEGSAQERAAVRNALTHVQNPALVDQPKDVTFNSVLPEITDTEHGVTLLVKCSNTADKQLTVKLVVTAQIVRYTGVVCGKLPVQRYEQQLTQRGEMEFKIHYPAEDFLEHLDENINCRLSYMAEVVETKQVYANQKIVEISKPDLSASLSLSSAFSGGESTLSAGQTVNFEFTVPSVAGVTTFTEAMIEAEGNVIVDVEHNLGTVHAGSKITKSFKVKDVVRQTEAAVIITFNSKEITGIIKSFNLKVTA